MRTEGFPSEFNPEEEAVAESSLQDPINLIDVAQSPPLIETPELNRKTLQLYQDNAEGLLRYATMLTKDQSAAQDAVQETFLRYFVFCSQNRTIDNERAWLFRVLKNFVLDRMKASSEKNRVSLEDVLEHPDLNQNPESDLQKDQAWKRMAAILSPRELECLRLRAEGFDYGEIASIMEVQTGTIGATLARAVKKIRKIT